MEGVRQMKTRTRKLSESAMRTRPLELTPTLIGLLNSSSFSPPIGACASLPRCPIPTLRCTTDHKRCQFRLQKRQCCYSQRMITSMRNGSVHGCTAPHPPPAPNFMSGCISRSNSRMRW